MHALTQFFLIAIACLVAARPRALEGPEEETPSFAAVVSAKEVERSFAAVEPPQRLEPRYSKVRKESEFQLFY